MIFKAFPLFPYLLTCALKEQVKWTTGYSVQSLQMKHLFLNLQEPIILHIKIWLAENGFSSD